MKCKPVFSSIISFRLTEQEKESLEELIQVLKTSKSEFLRGKMHQILNSFNNNFKNEKNGTTN